MKQLCIALIAQLYVLGAYAFDHSYSSWDALLSQNVKLEGAKSSVDYKAFVKEKKELKSIAEKFSAVKKDEYNSWSKEQKLSFLINAYNVFTIQLIVDHYPVDSIKSRKITWLSPFKKDFFSLFGKEMSLGHLEHEILRKDFKEARIHFAINCASIGCPALMDEAFRAKDLEQQLEKAAKLFANDKTRNRLDKKEQELQISKIFDWFESDFKRDFGSVKAFFLKYAELTEEEKRLLLKDSTDIDYLDYDWKLNEKK
jgi:hypothetical protein